MNDMSATIAAKSDQINAADLIGAPRTITIREVRIKAGEDQPVTILIEGDSKAFRPCKGVRRLMVRVWGADANQYIGQSMTLFCDPKVTWAGKEEGGIRVSHMTGLNEKIVEFMRVSRAATKPYEVFPLKPAQPTEDPATAWTKRQLEKMAEATALDDLEALEQQARAKLAKRPELLARVQTFADARRLELTPEGKPETEQGEAFTDAAEWED